MQAGWTPRCSGGHAGSQSIGLEPAAGTGQATRCDAVRQRVTCWAVF